MGVRGLTITSVYGHLSVFLFGHYRLSCMDSVQSHVYILIIPRSVGLCRVEAACLPPFLTYKAGLLVYFNILPSRIPSLSIWGYVGSYSVCIGWMDEWMDRQMKVEAVSVAEGGGEEQPPTTATTLPLLARSSLQQ